MNESARNIKSSSIEIYEPKKRKEKKIIITFKKYIIFIFFLLLGFLNHLGNYLIMTSSQQFATKLDNESLIACYPLALIIFSSFVKVINSKYLINLSFYKRIMNITIQMFIGFISFFFILDYLINKTGKNMAFWLTLIPTTIVGMAESFGDVTIMAYAGTFKTNYISSWNIGASLAGICGSFLSLLFKKLNTNLKLVYLFLSPISFLYFFTFYLINKFGKNEKKNINGKNYHKIHEEKISKVFNNNNNDKNTDKKNLSKKNFVEGVKLIKKYLLNLSFLIFMQYTICYCFCERANKYKFINSKGSIFEKIQYEAFLLFFEFGVVLSNSLLLLIRHIQYLEIFTFLQIINFILWFLESLLGTVKNQWICYLHLFFVGFCGGGGNIGFFDRMTNSKKIPPKFQELCINICEVFMDFGILISSIMSIIFDNTFMKHIDKK